MVAVALGVMALAAIFVDDPIFRLVTAAIATWGIVKMVQEARNPAILLRESQQSVVTRTLATAHRPALAAAVSREALRERLVEVVDDRDRLDSGPAFRGRRLQGAGFWVLGTGSLLWAAGAGAAFWVGHEPQVALFSLGIAAFSAGGAEYAYRQEKKRRKALQHLDDEIVRLRIAMESPHSAPEGER